MTRSVSARELVTEVELAVLAGQNLAQIEAEILASSELDEESTSTVLLDAWGDRKRVARKRSITPFGWAVYPNVDLYSGPAYEAIGVPAAMFPVMFPVMFALARSAGWIAQWLEMVSDPEQQTVRPRQIYTGELNRGYIPIAERDWGR